MTKYLNKVIRLLNQIRGLLPSALPVGMTEFDEYVDALIATYPLPTTNRDSICFTVATAIMHLGPTTPISLSCTLRSSSERPRPSKSAAPPSPGSKKLRRPPPSQSWLMSNPYKTKEFLALQKTWEKKLERSGLENIEQPDGNLKVWSTVFVTNYEPVAYQAKEEYYRLAAQMLHEHPFKNAVERFIWEQHSKGTSIRNITRLLNKKGVETYKGKVHKTLQALVKELMGKCLPKS